MDFGWLLARARVLGLLGGLVWMTGGCARAHTRDEVATAADKIPPPLEEALADGQPRNVLIELAPPSAADAVSGDIAGRAQGLVRDPGSLPTSQALPIVEQAMAARAEQYQKAQAAVLEAIEPSSVTLLTRYEHVPFMFVRIENLDGLYTLAERPEVLRLHEERLLQRQVAQSLQLIHQPEALASGNTGAGTAVAVLDTGVDYRRSDFGACTKPAADGCKVAFAADMARDDAVLDDAGHGTNVAAIVASVAPDSKLLALDVFAGSTAPSSAILAGIDWTLKNRKLYNIVALNLSLGSGQFDALCGDDMFASAISHVRAAGIVPVIASGNTGYTSALNSPACAPAALSVGAVYDATSNGLKYASCSDASPSADRVACFSNSAQFLSLLAPGALITAGGYRMTGTSQAAPHVAGALAVIRGAFPDEPLTQSIARLLQSGSPVTDPRNGVTTPRLDLEAALDENVPIDNTPPSGTLSIQGGASATGDPRVTLGLTGSDPSGDVLRMCVTNTATCTAFEAFKTSRAWTLSSGDGTKTVRVLLQDTAGNQRTLVASILLDTQPPTGGTLRATPGDRQVTLTWTAATDAGSGIASYRIVGTPDATPSCSSGKVLFNGNALTFTHTGLKNGALYGYRLCPVDRVGHVGNAGNVGAVAARPAPELNPPVGSVKINGGATLTNNTAVTLTLAATDPSGVASLCLSNSASCTSWEPYKSSRAWTLGATSGTATVSAWFRDAFGNTSPSPVRASIAVDRAAPSDGSLSGLTGSQRIALSWTKASDPSGIASYRLVVAPGNTAPSTCDAGVRLYAGLELRYTHTGLRPGTTYSYRLCAYDKAGNGSRGLTRTITAR
ncbi:MAG: S8 family serine peptidase [Polyangiales bacterium]